MKPNFKFTRSALITAGLLMVVFLSSCGSSYNNASVQNDGIYANEALASRGNAMQENNTSSNENSQYYQNYFDEQDKLINQARGQNEVFTDVDAYSSQNSGDVTQDNIIVDPDNTEYNAYGGWGTQPTSVTYNYIDNSFGWGGFGLGWGGFGPGFGWGGFGPGFGWGGFGPGFGWGGFGPGFGWGGFGPRFGWGGFGWGGFYGPAFGWGGFYGPAFGFGGFNPYHGLAFHNNYRNDIYGRNRSNLNYSERDASIRSNRGVRSNQNLRSRESRSSSELGRARSGRSYVNSDGRRIRNSSNVNARVRSSRANNTRPTTTSRNSRSSYSNQSIYRNSSRNSSYRSRGNNRSYTPRSSSMRTRSSGSSSRVRSSGGSSRSSGSRSSGGRSGGRGGRR